MNLYHDTYRELFLNGHILEILNKLDGSDHPLFIIKCIELAQLHTEDTVHCIIDLAYNDIINGHS